MTTSDSYHVRRLSSKHLPADIAAFLSHARGEWLRSFYRNDPLVEASHLNKRLIALDDAAVLFELRDSSGLQALAVLERLDWDSQHFELEMHRVSPVLINAELSVGERRNMLQTIHRAALDVARDCSTRLLFRRLRSIHLDEIRVLETIGYRLSDNVVTMTANLKVTPISLSPELAIRPLSLADVPIAQSLMAGSFSLSRFCIEPALAARGEAVYAQWLANAFSDSLHPPLGRVVECDGEVAGFTLWTRDANIEAEVGCRLASLDLFVVGQTWRGRGLGGTLLADTLCKMAESGAEKVEASTWIGQSAAMAAYQKAGFVVRENLLSFFLDVKSAV